LRNRRALPSLAVAVVVRSRKKKNQFTCFALADLLISLRALAPRSRASGSKDGVDEAAGVFSHSASEEAAPVRPRPAATASIEETAAPAADDDDDDDAEEEVALPSVLLPVSRIRRAAAIAAVRNIAVKRGDE